MLVTSEIVNMELNIPVPTAALRTSYLLKSSMISSLTVEEVARGLEGGFEFEDLFFLLLLVLLKLVAGELGSSGYMLVWFAIYWKWLVSSVGTYTFNSCCLV